ncbi:unnamed protein product, partial [Gadus morhua 'NCC']
KNNFNPERSQSGYLLFYRKRERQTSDSPQEDHHGSSVDPVESETHQNNADDGNADLTKRGDVERGDDVWAGVDDPESVDVERGDDVRAGVDVPESADVKRDDDVRAWVELSECGEVTRDDDVRAGVDVPEHGEVTGGDVMAGDPQTLESARLDGKGGERIKRDEELPTNEMDSRKPGDQASQQEASGTDPMVSDLEGRVNERRRGQREIKEVFEVFGEGETDIPNSFSGMCLSFRPRLAKRKQRLGSKVDMVKDKKSIKKRRKKNGFMCYNKQTSDTE